MLSWLCFCPSSNKDSQVIEAHKDYSSIPFPQHSIICKSKNKKQRHPILFCLINLSSAFHCKTSKGKPVTFACIPALQQITVVQDVEMASQFLRNSDFNLLAPHSMETLPLKQCLRMLPDEAFIVLGRQARITPEIHSKQILPLLQPSAISLQEESSMFIYYLFIIFSTSIFSTSS